MKINITPNTDQIRFYAQSSLRVWGTLPDQLAKENVIATMRALLNYLDACDRGDGMVVLGIAKIERGIRLEISRGDHQFADLKDRYAGDGDIPHLPGDLQNPVPINVENVRSQCDGRAPELEVNLQSPGKGGLE